MTPATSRMFALGTAMVIAGLASLPVAAETRLAQVKNPCSSKNRCAAKNPCGAKNPAMGRRAVRQFCGECHQAAKFNDYVFGNGP